MQFAIPSNVRLFQILWFQPNRPISTLIEIDASSVFIVYTDKHSSKELSYSTIKNILYLKLNPFKNFNLKLNYSKNFHLEVNPSKKLFFMSKTKLEVYGSTSMFALSRSSSTINMISQQILHQCQLKLMC